MKETFLGFLRESVFSDEYALKNGLLQALDPRVKLITFLSLILQALFARHLSVLIFLYFLGLLLAYLSRIRLLFFLKRTWVFIPLFSLFIAIPALFESFTPGIRLFALKIAGMSLVVTKQGLMAAVLFIMRVAVCVSFTVLLSITTKHFELLRVLRVFKVPQVFVMVLGMCYRYIYLFIESIQNTYLAIKSRSPARVHYKKGQQVISWNIAYLWVRSCQFNEDVYRAMLSRGFAGEPLVLNEFKIKLIDWLWMAGISAIVIILWQR